MTNENGDFSPPNTQIAFEQRYLQDLKQMKKEEQAKAELTDGRRRWFNREMDNVRSKIDELIQKQKKDNN